jgi:hypothetical protein
VRHDSVTKSIAADLILVRELLPAALFHDAAPPSFALLAFGPAKDAPRSERWPCSIDCISATQLHSSSNGGSLPHGRIAGLVAAPPLGPDTPLVEPDPLLNVDTVLDP